MTDADPEQPLLRVVVADDHPLFRAALAELVERHPGFLLVQVVGDGLEAVEAIVRHEPDIALLDMRMPRLGGLDVAKRLRESGSSTRLIFLSEYHDGDLVAETLEAGAGGYLAKSSSAAEIAGAITRVALGEVVLDPKLSDEIAAAIRVRAANIPQLSPREKDVLRAIAAGRSSREIALEMKLAVPTVKTHLAHLYQKLGVKDRGAAVAEAMRRGLID